MKSSASLTHVEQDRHAFIMTPQAPTVQSGARLIEYMIEYIHKLDCMRGSGKMAQQPDRVLKGCAYERKPDTDCARHCTRKFNPKTLDVMYDGGRGTRVHSF